MAAVIVVAVTIGSIFWAWSVFHWTDDYGALPANDWAWMVPGVVALFAMAGVLLFRSFEHQGRPIEALGRSPPISKG
jgi:hypothetical protein